MTPELPGKAAAAACFRGWAQEPPLLHGRENGVLPTMARLRNRAGSTDRVFCCKAGYVLACASTLPSSPDYKEVSAQLLTAQSLALPLTPMVWEILPALVLSTTPTSPL